MKKEKSCGCIIIKDNEVLLIKEKHGNFWSFPKGHMEKDETEIDSALRETYEEVGLKVTINKNRRYELHYIIDNNIDKTVVFYLASILQNDNVVIQESEIADYIWIPIDKANQLLTHDNTKEMFKKVINDIKG